MEKQVGMIYDEDKSGLAGEYEPKEHGQADAKAGQSPCCDRFPSALVHWSRFTDLIARWKGN